MKSRLASVRAEGGLDRVDRAVQLLEEEWRRHGEVRLENFWADQCRIGAIDPADSLGLLAALVKADLRLRYDQGQTPTTGSYLDQFPELRNSDSRVLSLVYEEFCLREERDGAPDVDSFCAQYPDLKSALDSQLRYHRLFSQAAGRKPKLPRFPVPGENFEEFHLLSGLGAGGTSRVFLARDLSLGGKQVALKVTLDRGQEPKVQGALDHPHIVPVNSVIYPTEGRLCGLSMPFRRGLPLDEIIKRLKPAERPRTALAIWKVLTDVPAEASGSPAGHRSRPSKRGDAIGPRGDGWEGFPVRGSYAQGVAWIVMTVARALHYAHGMRTFHRDVKPANVLLTLQHGPQLLDFNLADSPHSADRARAALHGGTPPYMAPEQIEAFLNPELWGKVGAQADIYSLGLVFRELLTGQMPELPNKKLSLSRELRDLLDRRPFLDVAVRRFNPSIPHSLAAIVAKCLALVPADRYASAEALARDIERFLKHLPLIEVANPSRREQISNWVMRRRRLLQRTAVVLLGVVLASGVLEAGVLLSRAINERRLHWVESSPIFLAAVRDIDQGKREQALGPLLKLEEQDPHAPLIKLYLSFALGTDEESAYTAERSLYAALAAPNVEPIVAAWAKDHSSVVHHLVDFADATMKRVDKFAEELDDDNPEKEEKRERRVRRLTYGSMSKTLRLAAKLDPSSRRIQRLLATTEEILGDYASAYARLTELLKNAADSGDDEDAIFFSRKLRGRVAFLWVESQRDKGPRLDGDTLSMLKEGKRDLEHLFCSFLDHRKFDEGHALKEHRVMHDQVRLMLTLTEVETDLKQLDQANRHLQDSRRKVKELKEKMTHPQLSTQRVPELHTTR